MKRIILFFVTPVYLLADSFTLETIEVNAAPIQESGSYVITQEEASLTRSITLEEKLKNDVSFSISSEGKAEETLSFRGLDYKATDYVEDGIPLYRNANGFVDPKFIMQNGDVLINDGSSFSTFGVSAMGGEVEIKPKKPTRELQSSGGVNISSNDAYYHASLESLMQNVYVQTNASYYHRERFRISDDFETTALQRDDKRVNSDKEQKNISLKSGIFIGDNTELAAKVSFSRSNYGIPPNVFTDTTAPTWDAYGRIDEKDLSNFYLYGDYEESDLTLRFRAYKDSYSDIYGIYSDASYATHDPYVLYEDSRLGTVVEATKKFQNITNTFVAQVEQNEHERHGGGWESAKFQVDSLKLSYMNRWFLSDIWLVESALTSTWMQQKNASQSSLDAQIKVSYMDDATTLYGGVAKKSRFATLEQMSAFFPWVTMNSEIEPEKSMQYSVGFNEIFAKKSSFDLSLYYYDIADLILYQNSTGQYINQDKAEHYGAEVRLKSQYFKKHTFALSYAYAHARDNDDNPFELIPEHRLRVEDTLALTSKLKWYGGFEHCSSRTSLNSASYSDAKLDLDPYSLVHTQLHYKISNATDLRVGIKNLFDTDYEWKYGYPSQGREFYINLEYKL